MQFKLTSSRLIVIVALFLVCVDNISFFKHVLEVYEFSLSNIGFLLSLGVVLTAVITLLVTLLSSRYTLKLLLITLVLIASLSNYFMNTYNVILDDTMIQNAMETNINESMDLLTWKLIAYFFFLGILPSLLIYRVPVAYGSFKEEVWGKTKCIALMILISLVMLFSFNRFYTSFFRENKPLRYYTNPTFCLYSTGKYIYNTFYKKETTLKQIGLDAKRAENGGRKLTIVVVGEAARANRFSLNGYERQTNPLLEKEEIVNFSKVYSCGTSTAISVPCMFSMLERKNYSDKEAKATENVLDIVKRSGASVLWRDNNSDSKGVALRVAYQDYRSSQNNTLCDEECRDEGMLVGLQEYVDAQKGDVVIVLHQMGNHGPAYYKRYPKNFEKFTPVCQTNQVEKCTSEEIGNAYDNVILYTDYFLSKTIAFLKQNDKNFQTAMIYMADHGESLGEKGLYLHGIPYFMAPDEQTHVGALMWFGEKSKERIDVQTVRQKAGEEYSHDNLFHTILGVMGVQTALYDQTKDILIYQKK
ncbi:phosphoethanolamine transferase [Sulfurospirillum sp. UCH001]|uniref:phosphoethanolamine transferase n=1 Tax=Sulfurospirillum sp. UCH001 TaxID=1581011 RepID=UPI0008367ACE|nr:phosphoethanolamine--lipid A transferase [Sulfurospirillum sp. UCH001]